MNEIWQTVLSIIVSVGGAGFIISAVVKFSADKIALRLEAKYQLKLDKELEIFKSKLDNSNLISRALFEKEFAIYQDLIYKLYDAFPHLQIAYLMRKSGVKIIKQGEITIDNTQLEALAQEVLQRKAVTEIALDNEMTTFAENMMLFKTSVERSTAFMPLHISKLFTNIWDVCWLFCNSKDEKSKPSFEVVLETIQIMNRDLNKYLKSLIIAG